MSPAVRDRLSRCLGVDAADDEVLLGALLGLLQNNPVLVATLEIVAIGETANRRLRCGTCLERRGKR